MFKVLPPVLLALSLCACVPPQTEAQEESIPLGSSSGKVLCAPGYTRPNFAALRRELTAAQVVWETANVRDYSYSFAQIAAPVRFPTVRVTVRGGVAQPVTLAAGETGEPGTQARGAVEDRFADIAQKLAYQETQPCPVVEVSYDARNGHPTRLSTGTGQENIADGNGEWTVTNFTRP
ncbi:DUF6174 domain-containing protein [Deinococcus sp. YIM 134068]|uniref:DUF6174 domain-containing protein n=1 Tax=Deinococcus lichenicola TaxID=3118910 RepID=UPI002F931FAE